MAFFFSYATVSSVDVAASKVMSVRLLRLPSSLGGASDERAEAGDRLADDQGLHLVGAFVGVDRFGVREVARHVVVDEDPVAAHHLAGPRDGLARLRRAE